MTTQQPSPEVKAIISDYVKAQREKYGDDWKRLKAAEMTAQTMPSVNRLLNLLQRAQK